MIRRISAEAIIIRLNQQKTKQCSLAFEAEEPIPTPLLTFSVLLNGRSDAHEAQAVHRERVLYMCFVG